MGSSGKAAAHGPGVREGRPAGATTLGGESKSCLSTHLVRRALTEEKNQPVVNQCEGIMRWLEAKWIRKKIKKFA